MSKQLILLVTNGVNKIVVNGKFVSVQDILICKYFTRLKNLRRTNTNIGSKLVAFS
jgi:hypothetical protein